MKRSLKYAVQLALPKTAGHGGKRKGAGRHKIGRGKVSRRKRPEINWRHPLHVTLRVLPAVGSLRHKVRFKHMKHAFAGGCQKFGLRMCDFSVQGDHIHLVVEADSKMALSRGMQGLEIRLAKHINKTRKHPGRVFADRYYARPLKTPREVLNTLRYVRWNFQNHQVKLGFRPNWHELDAFSSVSGEAQWFDDDSYFPEIRTVAEPQTWLLKHAPPTRVTRDGRWY